MLSSISSSKAHIMGHFIQILMHLRWSKGQLTKEKAIPSLIGRKIMDQFHQITIQSTRLYHSGIKQVLESILLPLIVPWLVQLELKET